MDPAPFHIAHKSVTLKGCHKNINSKVKGDARTIFKTKKEERNFKEWKKLVCYYGPEGRGSSEWFMTSS
jgi:hypothetical protein